MLRPATTPQKQQREGPVEFFKMAGGGNDFVIIDNRSGTIAEAEDLALRVCTRRLSVGGDGLILIEPSLRATFKMRYLNADGSNSEFCANGTRCAARFAFLNVIAPRRMTIETGAGVVGAEINDQQLVTLSLPSPWSFVAERPLELRSGVTVRGSSIMVGVPHYVIFLRERLWEQEIDAVGREIRHHPLLQPAGANVNFVRVINASRIEVRTWERGVEGETLACGSGVVASTAVAARFGRVESPVTLKTRSGIEFVVSFELRGGILEPEFDALKLTGDARYVYRSQLTPETLEGFDAAWVRAPRSE